MVCQGKLNSPAVKLINIAIKLEFTKKIPKKEISKLYADISNNPLTRRLLQELVIQHLYLNHVKYQDRQWISETLKIPITSQRALQAKKDRKQ